MLDKLKQRFAQATAFLGKTAPETSAKQPAKEPVVTAPVPKIEVKPVTSTRKTALPDGRKYLITHDEVLMGRDKEFPLTPQLEANLEKLVETLNYIRYDYGKPMVVSSGYRPGYYNTKAGGAKASAHLTCEACDFKDGDGALDAWCLKNVDKLKKYGLRIESPDHTKGWCHLDTRYKGGNPVFIP